MNQGDLEKLVIQTQTDNAVTAALLKQLTTQFAQHVEDDKGLTKAISSVSGKLSKLYWTVGGAAGVLAILEALHVVGVFH